MDAPTPTPTQAEGYSKPSRPSRPSRPTKREPRKPKFQPMKFVDCNTDKPRIFTQCYKCDVPLLIQTHHDGSEPIEHRVQCPSCNHTAFIAMTPKVDQVIVLQG